MENIVIVDCIRTGLAKAHRGTFNLTRSDDLVAHCINALLERNPAIDPGEIEDVILGCLLYTSPSPRDGLLSRMPSSA